MPGCSFPGLCPENQNPSHHRLVNLGNVLDAFFLRCQCYEFNSFVVGPARPDISYRLLSEKCSNAQEDSRFQAFVLNSRPHQPYDLGLSKKFTFFSSPKYGQIICLGWSNMPHKHDIVLSPKRLTCFQSVLNLYPPSLRSGCLAT